MSKSGTPSPERTQGAIKKSSRSDSVNVPVASNEPTERLSELKKIKILTSEEMDSLDMSPMSRRLSLFNITVAQDTKRYEWRDVDGWWEKVEVNPRDVLEDLEYKEVVESNSILDEFKVLSSEMDNSLDIADRSENKYICSTVLPPWELFSQIENVTQNRKKIDQLVMTRDSVSKPRKQETVMSKSGTPSPERTQGAIKKSSRSDSVNVPVASNEPTERLTELKKIKFPTSEEMDSLDMSPMSRRLSLFNITVAEDTKRYEWRDVDGWWEKVEVNPRDVLEVLEHKEVVESNSILDEFKVLSSEMDNSLDIADRSENKYICSTVLPPWELFSQIENVTQNRKKIDQLVMTRESVSKPRKQVQLFENRKNMSDDFIVAETEFELPESILPFSEAITSRQAAAENEPIAEAPTSQNTTGIHSYRAREAAINLNKTHLRDSFTLTDFNTSISETQSIPLNISHELSLIDSSAERSGWDSHITTLQTIPETSSNDFKIRKHLRTLKRQSNVKADLTDFVPQVYSTDFYESYRDAEKDNINSEILEEYNNEESRKLRQKAQEIYLQEAKQRSTEERNIIKEYDDKNLAASLEAADTARAAYQEEASIFKVPPRPNPRKQTKPQSEPSKINLPVEILEDMKYKPPMSFRPRVASWLTKRMYRFLETKLEPRYTHSAQVRAERLAETIYNFTKELRKHQVAPSDMVHVLKHEMARLDIVRTHFDFHEFFHDFMPAEVRHKVVPDHINNIPLPRDGIFADILPH